MKDDSKNLDRKMRVLKLHAIVNAFQTFNQMELNRQILSHKNDWNEAESTRNLIHFFFPDRELKIEDFIHNKDELSDKVLRYYDKFKHQLFVAEFVGIPQKTVEAFCRNVFNTFSVFGFRSTEYLHFPMYFDRIYKYLDDEITKEELIKGFVEYSIFTGKAKPARFSLFRKSIIQMELLINEIVKKQAFRSGKFVDDYIKDECELTANELVNIPF